MAEIIEHIGDASYPVGLQINFGIIGVTSVSVGSNVMAAVGEATHGPAMTVMPLTSEYETAKYFQSGPLARAGTIAFAQKLAAGYFIRVLGDGYKSAKKYIHDGLKATNVETFYGDGTVGPYQLGFNCYTTSNSNSVTISTSPSTTKELVYSEEELAAGKAYLDQENGTLKFYTGEGPTNLQLVTCSLEHYNVLGSLTSPNDGITGNSAYMDVEDGTFPGHSVETYKGDGSEGPYYLRFHDIIDDEDNRLRVGDTEYDIVYSSGDLATHKAYINKATGAVTFFTGEGPSEYTAWDIAYMYKSKCITICDGETAQSPIDSLVDLVAIQSALMYDQTINFTPNAYSTHLPANGRYRLTGGADGAAITAADYGKAMDVLAQYIEDSLVNVATVVFCANKTIAGTYNLIPILSGKLNEFKKNFYPCIGFIGLDPAEDPDRAAKIVRNFANNELVVVMNPWDKTQPDRMDATVARASQEAQANLGVSCARRVTSMSLQGLSEFGLLNTYRRETIKALHNNRLDVLVKTNGAIFSFYGRNTALEEQYRECVDMRTVNTMTWIIKYYTDTIYFAQNTPAVRATFRENIANVLDRFKRDGVMDAYNLTVSSGRSEGNKGLMRVRLEAENVGHIKQVIVDYYNGIIADAKVE